MYRAGSGRRVYTSTGRSRGAPPQMILVEELETAKTMGWHAKMSGSNPAAAVVGCCSSLHPHSHTHKPEITYQD